MIDLRGIVQRIITEPDIHLEYVLDPDQAELRLTAEPEIEWTRDRWRAKVMPLEEAQTLAGELGVPARAVVISTPSKHQVIPNHSKEIPADVVYEREERRGLA